MTQLTENKVQALLDNELTGINSWLLKKTFLLRFPI